MIQRFSKYGLLIFLLLQLILYQSLKQFPLFVEKFYSQKWFQVQGFYFRKFFGFFPFSIGDCIYGILIFIILKWFYNNRKKWQADFKKLLLTAVNFLSIFYFMFHVFWGFNYYRQPLSQKMQLKTDYDLKSLVAFTKVLIQKTNTVQFKITKNKNKKVNSPFTETQMLSVGMSGFENLAKKHAFLEYKNTSVKSSLFSKPLSYMGFAGYLNPFTIEAQINICVPNYTQPLTISHEMAHQLGYAGESDCNFIGYLATTNSSDLFAQYSGYSFALRYCMSVLKKEKPAIAQVFFKQINAGILNNFKESAQFWQSHESIIETGLNVFYDRFLKSNNQQDGVQSYGKFLNLLINYEKQSAVRTKTLVK